MDTERYVEHELTDGERAILHKMLSRPFRGSAVLFTQAEKARVRWVVANGSPALLFNVSPGATRVDVPERTPVDAELRANDVDGTPICVVLHVVDGLLHEIEMYREDGAPVQHIPKVAELEYAYPEQDSEE